MIFSYIVALVLICFEVSSVPIESKNLPILDNKSNNVSVDITNFYVTTDGIGSHKLHLNAKNWEDARVACLNEGAHLAVIKSAAEEAMIMKKIVDSQLNELWIGIHDRFKDDDWVTVQDQRLDSLGFVHWRDGEPSHSGNSEHCVSMTKSGMNDLNCDSTVSFLCKIG